MAKALDQPPGRTTVDQFLGWAMAQPDGPRYELVAGEVVAGAGAGGPRPAQGSGPAGVARRHQGDGMTVRIDEHTAYEPDAIVHCEKALPDDAVLVPAPVIVVEVLSPSTATRARPLR